MHLQAMHSKWVRDSTLVSLNGRLPMTSLGCQNGASNSASSAKPVQTASPQWRAWFSALHLSEHTDRPHLRQ